MSDMREQEDALRKLIKLADAFDAEATEDSREKSAACWQGARALHAAIMLKMIGKAIQDRANERRPVNSVQG